MDQFYTLNYRSIPNATLAVNSKIGYMIDVPTIKTKKLVSLRQTRHTPSDNNIITKTYSPKGSITTEYPGGWEITRVPKKGAYIVHNGIGTGYLSNPSGSKEELNMIIDNLKRTLKYYKEDNAPQKIISFLESTLKNLTTKVK